MGKFKENEKRALDREIGWGISWGRSTKRAEGGVEGARGRGGGGGTREQKEQVKASIENRGKQKEEGRRKRRS